MSLTYDGIIHRSLEEQVRYDAEQVQILKQADVTINENLQTINTEIDGKLTKPANPSAESAVTMLADGTVGTKPLSEIGGGGGGKVYKHTLDITFNEIVSAGLTSVLYSTNMDALTNLPDGYCYIFYNGAAGIGVGYCQVSGSSIFFYCNVFNGTNATNFNQQVTLPIINDTVTEV